MTTLLPPAPHDEVSGPNPLRLAPAAPAGLPTRSVLFGARRHAARAHLPDDAVFCGDTALWIHGVDWFSGDDGPIHVAMLHTDRIRRRDRRVVRARSLHPGDVVYTEHGPVTSIERTAYDVARDPLVHRSVPRLDALARATDPSADVPPVPDPNVIPAPPCGIDLDGVQAIVDRHAGARWIRRVHDALQLMDGGARSGARGRRDRLRVGGRQDRQGGVPERAAHDRDRRPGQVEQAGAPPGGLTSPSANPASPSANPTSPSANPASPSAGLRSNRTRGRAGARDTDY